MIGGWLKVKLAAEYAGVSERTFRAQFLRRGLKHSRLPSGTVLIKTGDIDKFLDSHSVSDDAVRRIVEETYAELRK